MQQNIAAVRPVKSILIIDNGHCWNVGMYGPESAGHGTDHVTVQSLIEATEALLVNLRRQTDVESAGGEVLVGEATIRALSGK